MRRQKAKLKQRMLAVLLGLVVFFSGIPFQTVVAVSAEETANGTEGSFYLAVTTDDTFVIEPVEICYSAEQTTLKQVLEELDTYEFGLNGDFVASIEQVEAGWCTYVDMGTYSLDMAPADVKVLGFTTNNLEDEDGNATDTTALTDLIGVMAQYRALAGNIQNYPAALEAYAQGTEALLKTDINAAAIASSNLKKAIEDYDSLVNGEKYTITVTAFCGEQVLENPVISFTDSSGNVTASESGSSVNVGAGTYSYVISDGGYNRVEGTLDVTAEMELQVALPTGEWFKDIQVRDKEKNAFLFNLNQETHVAEFYIDDTVGEDGLYLYAEQGAVPEAAKTKLITCYTGTDGVDRSGNTNSWNSSSNTLPKCLNTGMEGREFQLEAHYEVDGYTQIQSYSMKLIRVPTLKELVVKESNADGTSILSGFASDVTEYQLTTSEDTLYVKATACGKEGYTITGDGFAEIRETNPAVRTITVSHTNGMSREYVLNIAKTQAVEVTLNLPENTSIIVQNNNGSVITPASVSETKYIYSLIPDKTYTYITTKETYFHTTAEFVAEEEQEISVAEPVIEHALENFALYDSVNSAIRDPYPCNTEFAADVHSYCYMVTDENSTVAAQATVAEGYVATALYNKQSVIKAQHGVAYEKAIDAAVEDTTKAILLSQAIAACGYGQNITLCLSKEENDVTWFQDYEIELKRSIHLSSMELESDAGEVLLYDDSNAVVDFDSENNAYYVSVSKGTESLTLSGAFVNEKSTTDICGGYSIKVGEQSYDTLENVTIPLSEEEEQIIEITVNHVNASSIPSTYQIHVKKLEAVKVRFLTTPENAIVFVRHSQTKARAYAAEDGSFWLFPGNTYTYTVTANGYVGQRVTDYKVPENGAKISVKLEKAEVNQAIDTSIEAQWSSFRDTPDNNCVTDVRTPMETEETALYWATKLGSGYGTKATGCPIIVDGYLYTYAGITIYKIDTVSGEVVASGTMAEASSYAINPPTYADGMIFIGLKDGRVQAFNAKTLESLWVYKDETGGQPNCPITYYDGYIYTGFWKGETQEANYVCISVTDEDKAQTTEDKLPSWTYTSMGGFYWAGAYVCDDYMLIGTDDGMSGYTTGYGRVISLDSKSGKILGDIQLPFTGDVRSSMTLYSGKFYFTTKGGYFYELSVNADGTFKEECLRYIKLENGSDSAGSPAMSTSTPTIYNGRAYVGVCGISQFGAYSGHNIAVLDLTEWKIAYSVPTQGYPQTSGLLTTAYEGNIQTAYIYFFDNYTPGKLRIISDQPGQTKATEITAEEYTQRGENKTSNTAKVLFTPTGNHAQYALCSPIVDEYGTIYFKNDSAYLMAVGSRIVKIEVAKQPDKTDYQVGETFSPDGMQIVATYSNGMTRDVTKYVTYSKQPLTADDNDFSIQFSYVLYQDKNGKTGVGCEKPMTAVRLNIKTATSDKTPTESEDKEPAADNSVHCMELTEIPAKVATLSEDGNIRYWKDDSTGKCYADAKGEQEITWESTIIYRPSAMKLSATKYTYNGKTKKPKVTVKDYNGASLKEGTDYTISYAKGRKNVGRYAVTITYKGNYSGSKKLYFYINPTGTSIRKLTAGSKKLTVTYKKKTAQVSGYEIQYSTNKNFKKATTVKVKSNRTVKQTIRKLKAKKKYYVRVRTYKTVKIDGKSKKLYSTWSTAKGVTIKK